MLDALVLFGGHPGLLEVFMALTNGEFVNLRWDPKKDPIRWGGRAASSAEIRQLAAVRTLFDRGYVAPVDHPSATEYVVHPSDRATAVQAALDALPEGLKQQMLAEA